MFSSPDGREDLMVECEGCGNLLYVRYQDEIKVSPCPLCGCFNNVELDSDEEISGRLILKSPLMRMSRNSVEEGRVSLPGLPEKVQEALIWLQENRWSFGFGLEQPDDESQDQGDSVDDEPKGNDQSGTQD
jgi:hypothetical protein